MTENQAELVGQTFRHFKGNLYRLEGFVKDSKMLAEMAVYRALYGERGLAGRVLMPDDGKEYLL